MSDVDIIIQVHTEGVQKVGNLSSSLRNLSATLRGINVPMAKLDAQTKAVHKALGITSRGVDQHAKSIKGLIQNQKILGVEQKKITADLNALRSAYVLAGKETTQLGRSIGVTTRELQAFSKTFRGMRLRAIGSDFQNISLRMSKLGKDAQFVGRSLLINLTLPLATFARTGLQTFKEVDTQLTRLTKVMENVAPTLDIAAQKITGLGDATFSDLIKPEDIQNAKLFVENFNKLNTALTQMSLKFGVAKQMVVSIGADFAELGVTSKDNIASLAEMTLELEKLGTMDIKGAQDLTQALFFQSKRALEANGALKGLTSARERETRAIDAARAQMYLFNAVENATALTLRDLGDALPEVGSMATSFGISMTEAAALLAPMKAAGLDIGASANSIKVSLQRLLAPTKQNSDMINKLAKEYGVLGDAQKDFTLSTKTGLIGLDATVRMFREILRSKAGPEGALRLMSDLFEKRQGPRMYLAIEQLDLFNKQLELTGGYAETLPNQLAPAEVQMARVAEETAKKFVNFNTTIVPKTVRSFKDIGNIARIATATAGQKIEIEAGKTLIIKPEDIANARAVRDAVGDFVVKKKQAEGIDIISEVKTEAGRALMIQLAGGANAAQLAQSELDRSLQTTAASIDKIKNAFKLFAADLIARLAPTIEKISKKVVQMYETWMSPEFEQTRKRITDLILSVGSFLAGLGPVILAMGTFQAVVGKVGLGLARFFPKLKNIDGGFVGLGKSAELAATSVNNFYKKYITGVKAAADQANIAAPSISALVSGKISKGKELISAETALGTIKGRGASIQTARLAKIGITDIEGGPTAIQQQDIISKYLRARPTATKIPRGRIQGAAVGIPAEFYEGGLLRPEIASAFSQYQGLSFAERQGVSATRGRGLAKKQIQAVQSFQRAQPVFAAKGVGIAQQISDTGQVGAMRYAFRDREITTQQARKIAGGGIGGLTQRAALRMEGAREIATAPIRSLGKVKQGAIAATTAFKAAPSIPGSAIQWTKMGAGATAYFAQLKGGQVALDALILKHQVLGMAAPGRFKMLGTAILGVIKNMKLATIATRIFKTTLMMTGIGAIIAGVAAVVFLVIKNMDKIRGATKAWDALKRAFGLIKDAAMEVIRPIQDLFAQFGSKGAQAEAAGSGIANIFTGIAKAVEFVAGMIKVFVEKVIQPYLYGIINIVMAIVSIFKGNWGDAFKFLIAAVASVAKGVINLFIGMGVGIVKVIVAAISKVLDAFSKIPIVGGLFGAAKSGLQAIGNFATSAMQGVGNIIIKGLDKAASLGVKKSTGAVMAGKSGMAKAGGDVGKAGNEAITNALGDESGVGNAMDKIKNKIKEGMADAAQKLYDFVVDRFSQSIKKFVSDSVKALNKQKEMALKVFDVQLNTLMKLEKAEESLTRKKEYETNRRKLIDDASLRQEQYRRNRALAIYEGRIDDARILDLEERQSAKESTQELATLDETRRKELAKENLEALREAINNAKELAGKFFDESIEKFQLAAEHITRIAPVTIEQYEAQLMELRNLSVQYADNNNLEFGKMFEKFSTTIAEKMPNTVDDFGKALGAFTTPLDALVALAEAKYGLGSEDEATVLGVTHAMSKAVIGITLGMLVDIGDTFATASPAITEKYGDITGGIKGLTEEVSADGTTIFSNFKTGVLGIFTGLLAEIKTAFLTPFEAAFAASNPTTVYTQAIADGNLTIKAEFEKTLAYNEELAKKMKAALDPAIRKWIELKTKIEEAGDAAKNFGGAAPDLTGGARPANFTTVDRYEESLIRSGIITPLDRVKYPTADAARRAAMKRMATGGYLNAPTTREIPAILHGGEFVLNAAAVKRLGIATLTKLNNYRIPKYKMGGYVPSKFTVPSSSTPPVAGVSVNSVSTVNIQVENFIGQEEWFKSMMKEYNVNVLPRNQKAAGLESRTFTTYNGINQGL